MPTNVESLRETSSPITSITESTALVRPASSISGFTAPSTGYPVQHSILSSTVIAKDCASADAYATAFMVMGLDSAKAFCEAHPELDAYFICSGEGDKYETYFTNGMKKFIASEK